MDKNTIIEALRKGERISLECKLAQSEVPSSVWSSYSAFANTYGGLILLGVNEDLTEPDIAKRFTVTGVNNARKIRVDFWNLVNDREKVSVNLLNESDVETVDIDGKTVIAIRVPRADTSSRPVYINNNMMRGTYRRNDEGDYRCSDELVKMMVRDAFSEGNDRLFLEHYSMDDIDIPTLVAYRNHFSSRYPEHVFNKLDHKEFLRQFGAYTLNRETGEDGLTMAGLLMFGKGLSVRERFDNLRLDYIDKSHLVGDQRYSDRLTYDGTWENNLYNFVTYVLPRLTKELPRPFQMEGSERNDDTPQHKAVREAMTNAVIHADLMLDGVLKVEKYDDRFVFTNPGLLKIPVEQIYAGYETRARNQRIQNLFRMIGLGENLGSGFPLILSACNEKHWLEPELIEQPELMQVKLILHIVSEEDAVKRQANVGKDVGKDVGKELTERQLVIIDLIDKDPNISAQKMSEKMSEMPGKGIVATRTVERDLAVLKELGVLIRIGGRKDGHWEINKEQLPSLYRVR